MGTDWDCGNPELQINAHRSSTHLKRISAVKLHNGSSIARTDRDLRNGTACQADGINSAKHIDDCMNFLQPQQNYLLHL